MRPKFNTWYVEKNGTLTYFVKKEDGFIGYTINPYKFYILTFRDNENFELEKGQKLVNGSINKVDQYAIVRLFDSFSRE